MRLKDILIWLGIFIIGSLMVSIIINPSVATTLKDNFDFLFEDSGIGIKSVDPLVIDCLESFEECKDIAELKYSPLSIKILKVEKFKNNQNAREFYKTWDIGGYESLIFGEGNFFGEKLDYPIVLIATRMKSENVLPVVAFCNSNGTLTKFTKKSFLC